MKEMIRRFTEAYGPSGNELVRDIITEEIKDYADEIRVDALGNLIAIKRPTGNDSGKTIMVDAHMDEIGLVITHIDEKGFLRFTNVGGISPSVTMGQRVIFANGTIGVIGIEVKDVEGPKDIKLEKMFIDIGASSREEARELVEVGDICTYHRPLEMAKDRLIAKAMDDRIGCVAIAQTLKELKETPHTIAFVFAAQEEVGLRGATTAAYQINPDFAIAVDITVTSDTPKGHTMEIDLGKGTAIKIKDRSMITQPKVKDMLIKTAKENNIPYQLEVLEFGGTDAGAINLSRGGVPAGVLSIPCRYAHTPNEMVDLRDVQATIDLLKIVLSQPFEL